MTNLGPYRGSKAQILGERILLSFFAILPFSYFFQVISKSTWPAAVPYLFLTAATGLLVLGAIKARPSEMMQGVLPVLFLSVAMHHVAFCVHEGLYGRPHIALRSFLLFTLPFVVFWLAAIIRIQTLLKIIAILAIAGLLISFELLYEIIETRVFHRSTWFQLANMDYVRQITGKELTQLYLPIYRPTGLLEHAHVSTFFLVIGSLAAITQFIYSANRTWIPIAMVQIVVICTHGARLPVIALIFTFTALSVFLQMSSSSKAVRRRGLAAFGITLITAVAALLADPFGTTTQYFKPTLETAEIEVPRTVLFGLAKQLLVESEWWKLLQREPADLWKAWLGHGITGTLSGKHLFSDDFFFLALPLQYGLIGVVLVVAMLSTSSLKSISLVLMSNSDSGKSTLLIFASGVLIVLSISMLHSGAIQRKAIFPLLPLAAGMVWRFSRSNADESPAHSKPDIVPECLECAFPRPGTLATPSRITVPTKHAQTRSEAAQ